MKNELMQSAIQYANRFRERARTLKESLRDLELKAAETKGHLHATDLAIDRLKSFRPDIGGDLQCPRCWIAHGVNSSLIPQSSETDSDWFKCRTCDFEFEVNA